MSGDQRALAVIGLLRQREVGLGAFGFSLAHGDGLGAKPSLDARQFGLRHRQVGAALRQFRDEFWVLNADQGRALLHVLRPVDVDLGDAAVDTGGHVEGPGLDFALHDQRFAPGEVQIDRPIIVSSRIATMATGTTGAAALATRDGAESSGTV